MVVKSGAICFYTPIKKYDLWIERRTDEPGYSPYGVEIQPPIGELAAQGLCGALTRQPPVGERPAYPLADATYMTRNDDEGTALMVYPRAENTAFHGEYLGEIVKSYIDPCHRLEVELHLSAE